MASAIASLPGGLTRHVDHAATCPSSRSSASSDLCFAFLLQKREQREEEEEDQRTGRAGG